MVTTTKSNNRLFSAVAGKGLMKNRASSKQFIRKSVFETTGKGRQNMT